MCTEVAPLVSVFTPYLINPILSLGILHVQDGEGVRLGESVHVRQVVAGDGQLHGGGRHRADRSRHPLLKDLSCLYEMGCQ